MSYVGYPHPYPSARETELRRTPFFQARTEGRRLFTTLARKQPLLWDGRDVLDRIIQVEPRGKVEQLGHDVINRSRDEDSQTSAAP